VNVEIIDIPPTTTQPSDTTKEDIEDIEDNENGTDEEKEE
jgi:hypothetical protein